MQVRVAYNREYCCACDFWNVDTQFCRNNQSQARPLGHCDDGLPGESIPPLDWEPAPGRIMVSSVKPGAKQKRPPRHYSGRAPYCRMPLSNPPLAAVQICDVLGEEFAKKLVVALHEVLEIDEAEKPLPRWRSLSEAQNL